MVDEMDEMDYGRLNGWDRLWQMKIMRWTMVDENSEMDYGSRNE